MTSGHDASSAWRNCGAARHNGEHDASAKTWSAVVARPSGLSGHEGALSAAGIAYYVALSFFPLLLVLVAGLGLGVGVDGRSAKKRSRNCSTAIEQPGVARSGAAGGTDARGGEARRRRRAGRSVSSCCWSRRSRSSRSSTRRSTASGDCRSIRMRRGCTGSKRLVYQRLKALGMLMGVGGFIVLVMITSMVWSGVQHALEPRIADWPVVAVGDRACGSICCSTGSRSR